MLLLWSGLIGSVGFGAGMPAFSYYFGTMIDGVGKVSVDVSSLGGTGGMGDLSEQSFMMFYIGIGMFFLSWF